MEEEVDSQCLRRADTRRILRRYKLPRMVAVSEQIDAIIELTEGLSKIAKELK